MECNQFVNGMLKQRYVKLINNYQKKKHIIAINLKNHRHYVLMHSLVLGVEQLVVILLVAQHMFMIQMKNVKLYLKDAFLMVFIVMNMGNAILITLKILV